MKVSVAIATYNGARFLRKQIESVLNQSFPPDEIIVTDDSSTDDTVAILSEYQAQGVLKFFINPQRLGVVNNFKHAVSLTRPGNFVALCDQDDEWMPNKIAETTTALQNLNDDAVPCMVCSDLIYIDENDQVLNASFRSVLGTDKYRYTLETLLYFNFVTGCTVLMNTKAKDEFLNMPEDIRLHDEWLALAVFSFGKAVSLNVPLVKYRRHDANVSISSDTRLTNRYYTNLVNLWNAISGKDDFLKEQFAVVNSFYELNKYRLPEEKKEIFERFLRLRKRSYIIKKLYYMLTVRQNKH